MDKSDNYEVKDLKLAEQGKKNIEWAESQMGALLKVRERFEKEKPLIDITISACLHVTKETAVLAETLKAAGATVALCGSNPLSTQDEVAAYLATKKINVYAWRDQSTYDYFWCINKVLDYKPQITMDDGADVVVSSVPPITFSIKFVRSL